MTTKNKVFLLTPTGVAEYPFLSSPDTKYVAQGEYKVKLKLDLSDEAQKLMNSIQVCAKLAYDKAMTKAVAAGKRPPKQADVPVFNNGTAIMLTAKLKASGVNKTTNQVFHQAPRIFDASNALWDKNTKVTHGSKLRLCVEVVEYDSPTTGAGVTLRLKDVQVIELGTGFSEGDSPFGAVEQAPSFGAVNQFQGGGGLAGEDDDGDF